MAPLWKPHQVTVSIFFFACAAGMFAAGLASLVGNKISALRLGLLGLALLIAGGFCLLALWNLKTTRLADWQQRSLNQRRLGILAVASALSFLGGWVITWTPLERFGKAYYYVLGIYPFIIWITCVSAAGAVLLFSARAGLDFKHIKENLQSQRASFILGALALGSFSLVAWAASARVVGMQPGEEDLWYGAGAPILAWQVQLAVLIGISLALLLNKWTAQKPNHSQRADMIIFILIWAVSAWLWAREPVRPDFLVTEPVAPNYELYPDYDARNYDLMSQHALIGNGINNGYFFDRALYPALLVYLHKIAGQDYTQVMALQAALYAVLPALLYLIGKHLHSRAAGLGLGILLALRGVTHLNVGDIIETAHPKHMLTEYPTAVMLALATYLLVRWAQDPTKRWKLAGLAGGLLGLATLLRPHPLALIPLVCALALVLYRHRMRLWLGVSALVVTAAIFSVVPWIQFSGHKVSVFDLYLERMKDVIRQRYPQLIQPSSRLPEPARNPHFSISRQEPDKSVLAFAIDNYLNNLVTSVQALPNTPYTLEPRVVVKKTDNFWKPYWDGKLTPWATVLLPLNLVFVALGLGAAWKRARFSGLIPLLILLVYFLANALARASGGRYLVPIDWVVVVYYLLGLFTLAEFGMSLFVLVETPPQIESAVSNGKVSPWRGAAAVLLVSFSLGALIPLSQKLNPPPYPPSSPTALVDLFIQSAGDQAQVSATELQAFLANPKAVILRGRGFYPRQFDQGEGLDISVYRFYRSLAYPRTLLTLLGVDRLETVVILPRTDAAKIANASEVLVLGCLTDRYETERFIRAWAVLRLEDGQLFERLPAAPLACPLPDPVCDDNNFCK